MKNLSKLLPKFSATRILVVGDLMLDRYWWGSVERISPEAPVPVVRLDHMSSAAGGAANVAVNAARLGARVEVIGFAGKDDAAKSLKKCLEVERVDTNRILTSASRGTIVKTRIVAHGQHVVRVDDESMEAFTEENAEQVIETVIPRISKADAVILSDYAKGVLSERIVKEIISRGAISGVPVFVDPKGSDFSRYKNATAVTPNEREAAQSCRNETINSTSTRKNGAKLLKQLNLKAALITRGEHGMMIFERDAKPREIHSIARDVYDVTGAGDTVIATLAVAVAAGANFFDAALIANLAAGLVVEEVGTTAIKLSRLRDALRG